MTARDHLDLSLQVMGLLGDSCAAVCVIGLDGVVQWLAGGGIRAIGTHPDAWIGQPVEDPWRSRGVLPALEGHRACFSAPDPVDGRRMLHLIYEPRYDGTGAICGVVCWWHVGDVIDE